MGFPGLGTWIERRALRAPDAVAVRGAGFDLTYGALAQRIRSFAADLIDRDVAAGDRVAYHGVNDPAALVSLFAARTIGAVWVPILPARPEGEVRAILSDSEPRVLVRAVPATHPDVGIPEIAADVITVDAQASVPLHEAAPDDLAILGYTSGTTGPPKGVMLSEANLLWNVIQMLAACAFTSADVTLAAAPFTRIGGIGVTVLPTLFAGGSVVVPPAADGPSVLDTIERTPVSVVFSNPGLLDAMVRAPRWSSADLSGVRTGVVGGGLVPEPLLRAYLDRGVRLRHGYGLTEAAPVVSLLSDDEAADRSTSVGKPLPFVDVRARRHDGGDCEPGEIGEWWIRGPNVCRGYWGLPPVMDADGWFPTGDVGSIDPEGYLYFLDRASSAVRIGGATVYPATVEARLYGAPGLLDAAVGEVGGRLIAAVVTEPGAEPDEEALLTPLRDALPALSVPSEIRIVRAIPRNAAGKVRRHELRELLAGP